MLRIHALRGLPIVVVSALALAGCDAVGGERRANEPTSSAPGEPLAGDGRAPSPPMGGDRTSPSGVVTLGFAGDVHFEYHLRGLLGQPGVAFGSMRSALKAPDLMMVNLETAITERGTEEPKEYQFRVAPSALDLLDAAGVDVASMANNHAADYGGVGLRDTLAAVRRSPLPVVGVGRDADEAFRPYRVTIRGTDIAVLAASTKRDWTAKAWSADVGTPGVAVAVTPNRRLLEAVGRASLRDDVVVVYLHYGKEGQSCPTDSQVRFAQALSAAGADVVVGTHAHVLLGSGWMGDTYVSYGLGNFLWYHQRPPETGMLQLRIKDGEVVGDSWLPAEHQADGPERVTGPARAGAIADWLRLRRCSGLAASPSG